MNVLKEIRLIEEMVFEFLLEFKSEAEKYGGLHSTYFNRSLEIYCEMDFDNTKDSLIEITKLLYKIKVSDELSERYLGILNKYLSVFHNESLLDYRTALSDFISISRRKKIFDIKPKVIDIDFEKPFRLKPFRGEEFRKRLNAILDLEIDNFGFNGAYHQIYNLFLEYSTFYNKHYLGETLNLIKEFNLNKDIKIFINICINSSFYGLLKCNIDDLYSDRFSIEDRGMNFDFPIINSGKWEIVKLEDISKDKFLVISSIIRDYPLNYCTFGSEKAMLQFFKEIDKMRFV